MINLEDVKADIRMGMYEVVDSVPYGEYELSILSERDEVVICMRNSTTVATSKVSEGHFLSLNKDGFDRLLGEILFYNTEEIED